MSVRKIRNEDEIDDIRRTVLLSAKRAVEAIQELVSEVHPPIEVLAKIKFTDLGYHPIEDRRLNLIEQVNQTFTSLVSLVAAREILRRHPKSAPLRLNIGTSCGSDIESSDRTVAAEVFAAVTRTNNRKLVKDVAKVAESKATHMYVFFFCPDEKAGSSRLERFPDVEIVAVTEEQMWGLP
jgi:hypothetical protein